MHHKFHPLITVKDCRTHIRSMSLIEDYLSNYLNPKLMLRAFLILIVRILAVASSYLPPIILTQMEDTPYKYFLMLISLFFDCMFYPIYKQKISCKNYRIQCRENSWFSLMPQFRSDYSSIVSIIRRNQPFLVFWLNYAKLKEPLDHSTLFSW